MMIKVYRDVFLTIAAVYLALGIFWTTKIAVYHFAPIVVEEMVESIFTR